jgi:tRNA pseudouridine38-40 synthase
VKVAADGFHPRYDAVRRSYHYHIFCRAQRDPLRERYAWRVWPPVSLERMQRAAKSLVGTYDFAAFGTAPEEGGPTVRQVFAAEWLPVGGQEAAWVFKVTANAYLYHMVRRMVGFQVEIGLGRFAPELVTEYLRAGANREIVPDLAPPNGLFLVTVSYAVSDDN